MDNDGKGWLTFAAVVLGVAGIMRIFDGIWAFRYKGAVPDHLQNALLGTTLKNYGWLWLIVGIVLILCALGVMTRSQLSRWIGVFAGAVIAISAIWWMPYYPIWSLTYIGIGVLVIYALFAYGGRQAVTQ
jgi:asparagine N-glycosylation enzyme membrane subunit Stt3